MGRRDHHRSSDKQSHEDTKKRKRKSETKDERLLRKAKEYVKRNKKERSLSPPPSHHRDDDKTRHDRTEDKDRRKRRGSDYNSSDSSSRHRKHGRKESSRKKNSSRKRKADDDEHHRKRSHHKEKRDKKSHKKEKKQSRDKNHKGKIDKSKLYPLGSKLGKPPEELLEAEKDYFAFHRHLWTYLYRDEGKFFGDLSSEEAREAFERFVECYNAGKLETAYYDPKGLPSEALEQSKTTRHTWAFQTSQTERDSLHILQEGVRKQTEYDAVIEQASVVKDSSVASMQPPSETRVAKSQEQRLEERRANRRHREYARTAEEEFSGGRKDGRERTIEKRKEKAATIHGSARDRDEAKMGGVELDDSTLYGGGGSEYQEALAREKRRKSQREQKQHARVAELQKKEKDRQSAMLQMLGLTGIKPGQKIEIKPRNDNIN